MEKLSQRKKNILETIDEEIAELEEKLAKVQPLINELNQLKRTRATLLSERSATGTVGSRTRLTMEQVIHAMRENDGESMTPQEIAQAVGTDVTVVRSHLNRYVDSRYRKEDDGWVLIGQDGDEEEDDEEDS